jgi:phosphatidylserine/phosphatidylglycerophosphate/cardiolipin synthase-like enzyme
MKPKALIFLIVTLAWLALLPSPAATQAPGPVVISELAWMGTTTSANDEWIELYNSSTLPISLAGWSLAAADGTPHISLAGTIAADGYYLLERSDDLTVPSVPADLIYTGALSNDGEDLVLRDAASNIVDRIDASSGWFAGNATARVPMLRVDPLVDGSQADNWTYSFPCASPTSSTGYPYPCIQVIYSLPHPLDYGVYFDERATTATDITLDPTPMEEALLGFIHGASSSIDVALYGLDRRSVIDALIAAHDRGVTVRVVGDDEAAAGEYSTGYAALSAAGIPLVTDSSTSKLQHNKFLVIDGQVVWTGSTNFTDTGFTLNANNSLVMTDTVLAGTYTAEFAEMFGGSFDGAKTDDTHHLFDYQGTMLESYFSPTDLPAFEVWDELGDAEQSVHFAMFYWTDDMLTQRVIQRLGAGVQVYGVWDQLGAANAASADEALCQAGAQIKIENFAGKVHHKFAVIDVGGSDPRVVLGSYNWTDSGAYDNDENTLIIHDAGLAQAYYAEWQRLWSALGDERLCIGGDAYQVFLPMVMRNATEPPVSNLPLVISLEGPSVHAGSDLRVKLEYHDPLRRYDIYLYSASLGYAAICSSLETDPFGSISQATCHVPIDTVPGSYQLVSILEGRDPTPANHFAEGDVVEVLP